MAKAEAERESDLKDVSNGRETAPSEGSRRDHILELAAQLFAYKGVAATTVRDIGNAAGILSGSLYYHFDSKEAIVKEIVRRYLHSLLESYGTVVVSHEEPRACIEGLITASFEAIDRDPHACEIFQNDWKTLQGLQYFPEFEELTGRVTKIWMDTIDRGLASGAFRGDVEPKLFYRLTRDAIWFTVRWNRRGSDAVLTLSEAASTVLLDGFSGSVPAEG